MACCNKKVKILKIQRRRILAQRKMEKLRLKRLQKKQEKNNDN